MREESKVRKRNGEIEKFCITCKAWKLASEFSPGGKSHGASEAGKHCECRACNAKRHRDRYATAKALKKRLGL